MKILRSKIFFFSFMFLFFAAVTLSMEREKERLSNEELWNIYYDFIREIKPYGIPIDRKEHGEKIKPEIREIEGIGFFTKSETVIIENNKDILVEINPHSGEIRSFELKKYSPVTPIRDIGNKMTFKLKEQEVINSVKEYLKLIKVIKFNDYIVTADNSYGYWIIIFSRTNGTYLYSKDCVLIGYSEKYGLIKYGNTIFSNECHAEKKVSKENAIEIAKKQLSVIVAMQKISGKFSLDKEDPILLIINPNLIKVEGDIDKVSYEDMKKTCLSYKVYFDNPSRSLLVGIYIDATTGEVIHTQLDSYSPF